MKLPRPRHRDSGDEGDTGPVVFAGSYEHLGEDILASISKETIGPKGMKIDRMFFNRFAETVREDETIAKAVEAGQWDRVIDYVNREVFDKPEEYYTLDKLRRSAAVDRRLTLREILEKVFGLIPHFKSKDELLEEEFAKFVADYKPEEAKAIPAIKTYFKGLCHQCLRKRQHRQPPFHQSGDQPGLFHWRLPRRAEEISYPNPRIRQVLRAVEPVCFVANCERRNH